MRRMYDKKELKFLQAPNESNLFASGNLTNESESVFLNNELIKGIYFMQITDTSLNYEYSAIVNLTGANTCIMGFADADDRAYIMMAINTAEASNEIYTQKITNESLSLNVLKFDLYKIE